MSSYQTTHDYESGLKVEVVQPKEPVNKGVSHIAKVFVIAVVTVLLCLAVVSFSPLKSSNPFSTNLSSESTVYSTPNTYGISSTTNTLDSSDIKAVIAYSSSDSMVLSENLIVIMVGTNVVYYGSASVTSSVSSGLGEVSTTLDVIASSTTFTDTSFVAVDYGYVESRTLYAVAVSSDNGIWYTQDSGDTWTQSATDGLTDLEWTSVACATLPTYSKVCMAGSTSGLYYSTDYGVTWTVSTTFPSDSVASLSASHNNYFYAVLTSGSSHFTTTTNPDKWKLINTVEDGIMTSVSCTKIVATQGQTGCQAVGMTPDTLYYGAYVLETPISSVATTHTWVSLGASAYGADATYSNVASGTQFVSYITTYDSTTYLSYGSISQPAYMGVSNLVFIHSIGFSGAYTFGVTSDGTLYTFFQY